jgi:hypothetical protein
MQLFLYFSQNPGFEPGLEVFLPFLPIGLSYRAAFSFINTRARMGRGSPLTIDPMIWGTDDAIYFSISKNCRWSLPDFFQMKKRKTTFSHTFFCNNTLLNAKYLLEYCHSYFLV